MDYMRRDFPIECPCTLPSDHGCDALVLAVCDCEVDSVYACEYWIRILSGEIPLFARMVFIVLLIFVIVLWIMHDAYDSFGVLSAS